MTAVDRRAPMTGAPGPSIEVRQTVESSGTFVMIAYYFPKKVRAAGHGDGADPGRNRGIRSRCRSAHATRSTALHARSCRRARPHPMTTVDFGQSHGRPPSRRLARFGHCRAAGLPPRRENDGSYRCRALAGSDGRIPTIALTSGMGPRTASTRSSGNSSISRRCCASWPPGGGRRNPVVPSRGPARVPKCRGYLHEQAV